MGVIQQPLPARAWYVPSAPLCCGVAVVGSMLGSSHVMKLDVRWMCRIDDMKCSIRLPL